MPRVGLYGASEERSSPGIDVRIDTEVFAVLSNGRALERFGPRPTIERWLDCWGGDAR
ncbi:hypothetical protein [Haloarcula nitratireducens]|uniref:Uncharacterized protein n=1 Tax=Haloarcula nitratireducens TaxID=2487749 RepID=A0AAW4P9Z9_9EURY|nr:hypothetical protein [Halomicroarcula nitratireducens]MBX0294734.1 hypothetical protein [Halomicroarcula nitratireducens]